MQGDGQRAATSEAIETARAGWHRVWDEARHGSSAARGFTPPPIEARLRRIAYGAVLPIAVGRALLRDPSARRRYLRVATLQAIVIWTLAMGFTIGTVVLVRAAEGEHQAGGLRLVSDGQVRFFVTLASALYAIEWIVVALSRDYHDDIGRTASTMTGVPPEGEPLAPRVRVNLAWTWRRVKRYLRGLKVFACGMVLIGLVQLLPLIGTPLYATLTALWGFHWLAIFNLAKTDLAWRPEAAIANERDAYEKSLVTAGAVPPSRYSPWFLRLWDAATSRVPGVRWWLPRWYGRVWRRFTFSTFPACLTAEQVPYETAGLGVARVLLGGIPGIYMFLRPLIPVAAAHAILAPERRAQPAIESPADVADSASPPPVVRVGSARAA